MTPNQHFHQFTARRRLEAHLTFAEFERVLAIPGLPRPIVRDNRTGLTKLIGTRHDAARIGACIVEPLGVSRRVREGELLDPTMPEGYGLPTAADYEMGAGVSPLELARMALGLAVAALVYAEECTGRGG